MNRYILFAGEFYYAKGGCHDLIGSYSELDEAIEKSKEIEDDDSPPYADWWHIFDIKENKIILQSEEQSYGVDD